MANERKTKDADAVVLHLVREIPVADDARGPAAAHTLKRQKVLELRDPLGIAFGMAESIPELVDDLRRLLGQASESGELAAVLDEMALTAELVKGNITRALRLVEKDSLRASRRR